MPQTIFREVNYNVAIDKYDFNRGLKLIAIPGGGPGYKYDIK